MKELRKDLFAEPETEIDKREVVSSENGKYEAKEKLINHTSIGKLSLLEFSLEFAHICHRFTVVHCTPHIIP